MTERPSYTTIATAIGEVSIWWAGVEIMAHAIAMRLVQLNAPEIQSDFAKAQVDILLRNMPQRSLFSAVKALAFAGSPADLFPVLEPILNDLDNDIRNERNRFQHDSWYAAENGAERITRATKIVNSQAGKRELKLSQRQTYATFAEIDHLTKRIKQRHLELEAVLLEINERLVARKAQQK